MLANRFRSQPGGEPVPRRSRFGRSGAARRLARPWCVRALPLLLLLLGACGGTPSPEAAEAEPEAAGLLSDMAQPADTLADAGPPAPPEDAAEGQTDVPESPDISAPPIHEQVTAEWLEGHLATLASDDMEGRDNLTPGSEKVRQYLIGELEKIGLTDPGLIAFVSSLVDQLNAWIEKPPQSAEEWQEYDGLVRAVLEAVHTTLKR